MNKKLTTINACFFAALIFLSAICKAQVPGDNRVLQGAPDSIHTVVKDTTVLHWLRSLYQPGVELKDDSILLNDEGKRLLTDTVYRKVIYPAAYSWDMVKYFIQTQHLQQAFWFFINLYLVNDKNKELVVNAILTYDKIFNMDKILVSTFYTYSPMDPEIVTMEGDTQKVTAPHIMEKKLNALREMLYYVDKYRPAAGKEGNTKK